MRVRLLPWAIALMAWWLASTALAASSEDEANFVSLINEERRERGLGELMIQDQLILKARDHSQTMADAGFIFHSDNLVTGLVGWYGVGENVGVGLDVEGLHDAFMASPSHRDALLGPAYDSVGIGIVQAGVSMYVTEVFMDSSFTPPFIDDDASIHEQEIIDLYRREITRGCNPPANTHYCPGRDVTRAEMATFLVRSFSLTGSTGNIFGDDDGSVHESNIETLAHHGITFGCAPARYCPDQAVTRAEMASFLSRVLELTQDRSAGFIDIEGSVHEEAINSLANAEITHGCNPPSNDRYCPEKTVTRAQMSSFIIRSQG